jgi:hypothetical protein
LFLSLYIRRNKIKIDLDRYDDNRVAPSKTQGVGTIDFYKNNYYIVVFIQERSFSKALN